MTRECANCGHSPILTSLGVKRVYQGTPSWDSFTAALERLESDPYADYVCDKCKTIQ